MSGWTDIEAHGWVAKLPAGWRPYALLARIDRPIGVWLLFLPGLWGILLARPADREAARLIVLFAIGALAMRSAGCVVNDMWDRDMDRLVTRTAGRPLASGVMRMRGATLFLSALCAIGLVILLQLNGPAQALGVFSLLLVVSYPLAKRVTWWPQAMLGITFGWGAPMGYIAAGGAFDAGWALLYMSAIAWVIGYDTIYGHQDREDDALIGVRSTARLFARHTRAFLSLCYAIMLLLFTAAGVLAGLAGWFALALVPAAVTLAWQVATIDIDDPARCLGLFKLNRVTGLLIALAILFARA